MKAGWTARALDQLCDVFTDGDWIESKDQSSSGIRLVQTGNVGNGVFKDRAEKARYISEDTFRRLRCTEILEGDCLVSRLPDPVARSCLIPSLSEKCITAVDCTIIRFDRSKIMPELFNYFSQSRDYAAAVAASVGGATRQRISRKNLGLLQIPLPPLDEQRQIVAVLDQAFASIATAMANAQKNLINARALFHSCLESVFKAHDIESTEVTLEKLVSIQSGFAFKSTEYVDTGHFLIRIGNVQDGYISLNNPKYVKLTKRTIPFELSAGDMLTSLTGNIGRVAVVQQSDLPAALNQRVARLVLRPNVPVSLRYVRHFLASTLFRETLSKAGHGTAQLNVSPSEIGHVRISYPSKQLQDISCDRLDQLGGRIETLATIFQNKLAALSELKHSLLQKAFAGELT